MTKTLMMIGCLAGTVVAAVVWAEGEEETAAPVESVAAIDPAAIEKYGPLGDPPDKIQEPTGEETGPEEEKTIPTTPVLTDETTGEELIYLNATDTDITEIIKQISKATGTNFLLDDSLKGKITIISEKPMTKDMAYQAFLSALEVMGYTTVATPAGLIKVIPTKEAINKPLDIFKDETPMTDRFITRIVQVKNISANEISSVVKTLVSKDGNLFAYPATNSLIITDTGSNIDRILKIIRELDQEGPQEVIEIIPIQYADAKDITEKITQLFEQESSGSSKVTATRSRRGAKGGGEAELQELPSISKVITDERTNSIIILGTKRAIIKVKALISRLDTSVSEAEGAIHVYYLKHADAKELADVLGSLVSDSSKSKKTTIKKDDSGASTAESKGEKSSSSGAVELEGGVKVTADEATNSLIITASPKDFKTLVEMVIAKLDIPRRQVYLEAIVMELSVNKNRQTGFSGNFGTIFQLFGSDMSGFGTVLPLATSTISSIAGAAGGLAGGVISENTIDFTLSDGSSVSVPAVSAIIQALQTDTDVNVLSTPSILTLDNEEAQIQVGEEVPTPSGTTVSSGGVTSFNVTREDTGIILKITPQISESDTVKLEISQEITNVVATDENLGPTLTKRSVETVVVAHDKQTVVIGGLIDDRLSMTTNKVPLIGDVPILGQLFKNKTTLKEKTNIIVFITPYIIREKADYLSILKRKIEERNVFIEHNYGPHQRKLIRESIANHAHQLLDYKGTFPTAGTMVPNPAETVTQETVSPTSSEPAQSTTETKSSTKTRVKYRQKN